MIVKYAENWTYCSFGRVSVWRFGMKCRNSHVMWHGQISLETHFSRSIFFFFLHIWSLGSGSVGKKEIAKKQAINWYCMHRTYQRNVSLSISFLFTILALCENRKKKPSTYFAVFFQISFANCFSLFLYVFNWFMVKFYSHCFIVCVYVYVFVVFLCKLTWSEPSTHLRFVVSLLFPFLLSSRFIFCSSIAVYATIRTLASLYSCISIRLLIIFPRLASI